MKEFILHLTKLISGLNSNNLELTDKVIFFKQGDGAGRELFVTTPQNLQDLIGGSSTPVDPITVVADYNALPDATTVSGKFYWCSSPITHTTLFITFTDYENGLYYSNGTTWEYLDVPMQSSQSETDIGTISDKFITPKTLNNYSGWNKTKVGLGNVDNTSDIDKPISTAQQEAIDDVQFDIDTHEANTSNPHSVTKSQVGLGNVDNTSDVNKPVSTFQAAAIAVVQSDIDAHEANTSNPHGVTKSQVGLSNVDNTADVDKPVSTAQQTALDLKANSTELSFLNPKNSVSLATTANISGLTYNNGSSGVGATLTQNTPAVFTLDGVTPVLGDRILFKDQSTASTNGVYTITTLGTSSVAAVFTRAVNYNQPSNINGSVPVTVIHGTVNQITAWSMVSTVVTVGTTSIVYTQLVYSRSQNDSRYFQISNNLSEGNATTIKTNLSLNNVTNNAQLAIANNLSDVGNVVTSRTNLGLVVLGKVLTSASGTNTTSEELITSFQVGSTNTINTNDLLDFYALIGWNSTAGQKTFKVYFSPTALLSDASKVLVATSALHTTNQNNAFTRRFVVLSDTSIQSNIPGAGLVDIIDAQTSGTNIPTAITVPSLSAGFYVLISGLKTVGTDTDTVVYAYMKRVI